MMQALAIAKEYGRKDKIALLEKELFFPWKKVGIIVGIVVVSLGAILLALYYFWYLPQTVKPCLHEEKNIESMNFNDMSE